MSWNFKEQEINLHKAKFLPNMHVHSKWCKHSTNELDYLNTEFNSGFFFTLNEHMPYPEHFFGTHKYSAKIFDECTKNHFSYSSVPLSDLDQFIEAICKYDFPIGFEVDYLEGFENESLELISRVKSSLKLKDTNLNHISLSIHTLHGYDLYSLSGINALIQIHSVKGLIKLFFDVSIKSVHKIPCDFFCHPGSIERAFQKVGINLTGDLLNIFISNYKRLVDELIKLNIPIEINTSGIQKGLDSPFMPYDVFIYAKQNNAIFILGSDWHHPELKFCYFDQLYDFLKKEQVKTIYKIHNQKLIPVSLTP